MWRNWKMLYVIKNSGGVYWCGFNKFSTQIRHAQIYATKKFATTICGRVNEQWEGFGVCKFSQEEFQ